MVHADRLHDSFRQIPVFQTERPYFGMGVSEHDAFVIANGSAGSGGVLLDSSVDLGL